MNENNLNWVKKTLYIDDCENYNISQNKEFFTNINDCIELVEIAEKLDETKILYEHLYPSSKVKFYLTFDCSDINTENNINTFISNKEKEVEEIFNKYVLTLKCDEFNKNNCYW